jgi:hypothetical protein
MNTLRLATEAEVESIKSVGDLGGTSTVVALDTDKGPILAVIRRPVEVDPVIWPEGTSDKTKYVFWRDIITGLKFQAVESLYFNIRADNTSMLKIAESLGAETISPAPELRWKKVL